MFDNVAIYLTVCLSPWSSICPTVKHGAKSVLPVPHFKGSICGHSQDWRAERVHVYVQSALSPLYANTQSHIKCFSFVKSNYPGSFDYFKGVILIRMQTERTCHTLVGSSLCTREWRQWKRYTVDQWRAEGGGGKKKSLLRLQCYYWLVYNLCSNNKLLSTKSALDLVHAPLGVSHSWWALGNCFISVQMT